MTSRSYRLHIPEVLNQGYLPTLDGLRGIAILTVIIAHAFVRSGLLVLGSVGVDIFFVLSGFLITSLLLKEKIRTNTISLKKFYIRRVLRIVPVAYLFLLVLLLLNHLFYLQLSTSSFVAAAFYIGNLPLHYARNWFTGHFWTLGVEEQFYLIFPFVITYCFRAYTKIIIAIILLVPLLQYVGFHNVGVFYTNTIIHKITYFLIYLFSNSTVCILVGSLTSVLMYEGRLPFSPVKQVNSYLSLGLFLFAIVGELICNYWWPENYFTSLIFSIVIASVICLTLIQPDILNGILSNKILIKIGILSYSLYIWQQLFLYKQPWADAFPYASSNYFNIPALFIIAYISYSCFELQFLKLKKHFK